MARSDMANTKRSKSFELFIKFYASVLYAKLLFICIFVNLSPTSIRVNKKKGDWRLIFWIHFIGYQTGLEQFTVRASRR